MKAKSHIIVENFGPLKHAQMDFNKINVIMGPQACGKSALLKIITYCRWLEKNIYTTGNLKYYTTHGRFLKLLKTFHRFDDGYFSNKTTIKFLGDFLFIYFDFAKKKEACIELRDHDIMDKFENSKLAYLPAERNLVGAIENLQNFKGGVRDNILNFIYEYNEYRGSYTKNDPLDISELKTRYYYNKQAADGDIVILNNDVKLPLNKASSGFISSVPLFIFIDFLTNQIFKIKKTQSSKEKEVIDEKILARIQALENKEVEEYSDEDFISIFQIIKESDYKFSQIFIEEPEQNLYPQTQRDLVYYLMRRIQLDSRNHKLFLTTHSPYILYALNNCMMGYLVKDKMDKKKDKAISKHFQMIDPKLVSIWEITNKGNVKSIQEKDGLIGQNYFDQLMKGIMKEFYDLLHYYE